MRLMGERYMVHDDLWWAIYERKVAHMLCVGCLEARVGRPLDAADFIDCPLNHDRADQSLRLRRALMSHGVPRHNPR